jgi:protein TonB
VSAESQSSKEAVVESAPKFSGGVSGFREYVVKNFRYSIFPNLKGKILTTFVVDEEGNITDIKVVQDLGHGTKEEMIRVLKSLRAIKPAMQNGKPIRVKYSLPIVIDTRDNDY